MSSLPSLMLRSSDGVFAIGMNREVLFWNPACEAITGIQASAAVGHRCHEVLKGVDPQGRPLCTRDCVLGDLAQGGPPPSLLPMRITQPDGKRIQLCVGTMLMPSPGKANWTVVHVLRRGRGTGAADFFNCEEADSVSPIEEVSAHVDRERAGVSQLTGRERDVLRLLANGLAIEVIAERLHISATTVRNHIQRMLAKLDVHSRHEAVAVAHRFQLI